MAQGGKAPAFQFYPKDFLSDGNVLAMSLTERGAYITLLSICWLQEGLPLETDRLAALLQLPVPRFTKLWENSALKRCFFVGDDGRLHHKRLQAEREKQAAFKRRQTDNANKRWDVSGDAMALPPHCQDGQSHRNALQSSISNLQSADGKKTTPVARLPLIDARSKRPIFVGQKLTVFEWMLDQLDQMLTPHTEAFRLDEWFITLDETCVKHGIIPPARDNGEWLKAETLVEAQRRGLPLKVASVEDVNRPTGPSKRPYEVAK